MVIADTDVLVTCPGRDFVTLEIYPDEGIYGRGAPL